MIHVDNVSDSRREEFATPTDVEGLCMGVRAEHRISKRIVREAIADEVDRRNREVRGQQAITLAAAVRTIAEGHVLHVRADALPGKRRPRRDAMPTVDLTVGPDGSGGFLVVDYSQVKSGEEEQHASAEEAIRQVRRRLGWDRLWALRVALRKVHGDAEKVPSRFVEEWQGVDRGARLRVAYGHKANIEGCMGGPSFKALVDGERASMGLRKLFRGR